jgi:stalled ribosome rescue protein Dom34
VDTQWALDQASVRDLYVTRHYLDEHAAEAEDAVRSALDQDASVEEVSGSTAEQLDRAGGVAAGLRFRPATLEVSIGV